MNNILFILGIIFTSGASALGQTNCNLNFIPNDTPCCSDLILNTNVSASEGFEYNVINLSTSPFNNVTCTIESISPYVELEVIINPDETEASLTAVEGVFENEPNVDFPIASVCFDEGTDDSVVSATMEIIDQNGEASNCTSISGVIAQCSVNPNCSCFIYNVEVSDCCHQIYLELDPTCVPNDYRSVKFTSGITSSTLGDISSFIPGNGFTDGNLTSTSTAEELSPVNLAFVSSPIDLGVVCFENSPSGVTSLEVEVSNIAGTNVCNEVLEIFGSCQTTGFQKICGTMEDNIPIDIHETIGDKIQVLGNVIINGVGHGTLTQYDPNTGISDWTLLGPPNTGFLDMVYEPYSAHTFVVGVADNNSPNQQALIAKVNKNGVVVNASSNKLALSTNRDIFDQIDIVHSPTNAKKIYLTGRRDAPFSTNNDKAIVMNLDANLSINFYSQLNHTGDDEMTKGIIPRPGNNGIWMIGNDSNNNRGVLVGINQLGNVTSSHHIGNGFDLYDGYELHDASLLLVGADFFGGAGFMASYDPLGNTLNAYRFPSLNRIYDVMRMNNHFYVLGEENGSAPNRNILIEFDFDNSGINILSFYTIDNNESQFSKGYISHHSSGKIAYTDGRTSNTGYGGIDMFTTLIDLNNLTPSCTDFTSIPFTSFSSSLQSLNITNSTQIIPPNSSAGVNTLIQTPCQQHCNKSCLADFVFTFDDCLGVNFTQTCTAVAPAQYNWDFDNDMIPDATGPSVSHTFAAVGTYTVCLEVIGADGCADRVCKQVNVPQPTTPLIINCPPDIYATALACDGGGPVSFVNPTISSSCGPTSLVCSHSPQDFFPCGTTTVTCTAMDNYGNSSSCQFDVIVDCPCMEEVKKSIDCTVTENRIRFDATLNDLTGSNNCSALASIVGGYGNVTILTQQWVAGQYYIAGYIDMTAYPFPSNFDLNLDFTCNCTGMPDVNCTQIINFDTPCCDEVSISTDEVCRDQVSQLDLSFFGTVNDIDKVEYYMMPGLCPPTIWNGVPTQTTIGYAPLDIYPQYFGSFNSICVYAKVYLGANEAPCDTLITDITSVGICDPFQCTLQDQEYCYMGTPVTPGVIQYTGGLPKCAYKIEWYDPNGNLIPSATNSTTYQPPALNYTASSGSCYQDYVYEMRVETVCGITSCSSNIRLWNEGAELGDLYLDPVESLPLCYGEDVTLVYDEKCTDPTGNWQWNQSIDGTTFNPIVTSGTRNPFYNSNRLFQDHWYRIEKTNGICPSQYVDIHIPVKQEMKLSQFNADPYSPCRNDGVKLSASYTPCTSGTICGCDVTIEWFKNGILIGTTNSTSPNAGFSYVYSPVIGDYSGYYYAEIQDNCCGTKFRTPTKFIDPPTRLFISGQAYQCNIGDMFTLNGVIVNPATSNNCTFQWYLYNPTLGWQVYAGATSPSLTSTKPGKYKLEMTCTYMGQSCTLEAEYEVIMCNPISVFNLEKKSFDFIIQPNPAKDLVKVVLNEEIQAPLYLEVFDYVGKLRYSQELVGKEITFEIDQFESGVYIVRLSTSKESFKPKKLIVID